MTTASICTIGDEILIGQIVDTNSSYISRALNSLGIKVSHMLSIGDEHDTIVNQLTKELENHNVVISTGGLGPTDDDITKAALFKISQSSSYLRNEEQEKIIYEILHSRGLDLLDSNKKQALVPDRCDVILNKKGTAPIMAFHFDESRFGHPAALYALPGVPFEAIAALDDVINDIKSNFNTTHIYHKTIMTYGLAESALAAKIRTWEKDLPADMHLAYLPNQLTGVRLRLSIYGSEKGDEIDRINAQINSLKVILGDIIYSFDDDNLESAIGKLLRGSAETLSAAESCTGGMISHLITTIPGSSEYYLGSVTSYAIPVKEKVLYVDSSTIEKYGVVSEEVAAAMAEGVRKLTGSTYSVSTTGLAGPGGDDLNPEGTVCIGVSGPIGTRTLKLRYRNDRKRNIERFAASALNELRKYILECRK